jgi:hypothetical protein
MLVYSDLSNNFYQKELPDLLKIDPNTNILRLTALYLHDISAINHLQKLQKLNISYTYVKQLPELLCLEELQMIEIDLLEPNDLSKCPNLKRLKMTHDNINLSLPLKNLEILHCSVVHRPDLLHIRYPNLKEIRFEHIHPINKTSIFDENVITFYRTLKYVCCKSSQTIIRSKNNQQIDDFDDEIDIRFDGFKLNNFYKEFAEGNVEYFYICKNLSHMVKYNIHTMRCAETMNIYYGDSIKSFEIRTDLTGEQIRETISDHEYIKIDGHYDKAWVYYPKTNDKYNDKNSYIDIIKQIIYNGYNLNEQITKLLADFVPQLTEDWSIDQLFVDIRRYGLTEELKKRVKFFDCIRGEYVKVENDNHDGHSKKNIIFNNDIKYYNLDKGKHYKELGTDEIKDVVWFGGRKYLLTYAQKKLFADLFKEENDAIADSSKNQVWARFGENGQLVHYKYDENGNKVVVEEIPTDENFDENFDETSDDVPFDDQDEPNNICQLIPMPAQNYRSTYQPENSTFNNIFLKNALLVADAPNDCSGHNYDIITNPNFLNLDNVIPFRSTARFHLNFYGRAVNFKKELIKNSNGHIMLGTAGDEGTMQHVDVLLDKNNDQMSLYLDTIYFIFKNRMYTNFFDRDENMIDYTNDIVILIDGTVGWGGTFYPFDVVIDPHPNLILERNMGIGSPLIATINHNRVRKCCSP